jgi:hypothetical protein
MTSNDIAQYTATADQIAAAFAADPRTMTVCAYAGHGYGTAKFASRCPFTGAEVSHGDSVRQLVLHTRDGRTRTGYTSNKIFGALSFVGLSPSTSRSVLPGSSWTDHRDALVASLDALQSIALHKAGSMEHGADPVVYSWEAARGLWRGKRFATLSTKQLAATLRRTTRVAAYHTSPRAVAVAAPAPAPAPARTHHPAQLAALLLSGVNPARALNATGATMDAYRATRDSLQAQGLLD